MLAFLSSSQYFWYNGQGRLHGGLRSSDADGSPFLSQLFWETACFLRRSGGSVGTSRLNALVVLHIPLARDFREKERFFHIVVTVFRHPQCQTLSDFRRGPFDSSSVQISCSRLSRSAEFCSAFPQCSARLVFLGCPSSCGSAVSPARMRSSLWNLTLRSNSLFPQRVTSFTSDLMKKLKNNPIVGASDFVDNEFDFPGSDGLECMIVRLSPTWCCATVSAPGTCSFYCYWSQRGRAGFRPTAQFGLRHSLRPFLMTCFFAEQVLTQLDLLRYWKETATDKNEVYYFLPNQLDEKMAIQPPCVVVHELMDAMSSCCGVPG